MREKTQTAICNTLDIFVFDPDPCLCKYQNLGQTNIFKEVFNQFQFIGHVSCDLTNKIFSSMSYVEVAMREKYSKIKIIYEIFGSTN